MARLNFHSDPDIFVEVRKGMSATPSPETLTVLGIDLGTNCGYTVAFHQKGQPVTPQLIKPCHMGQWDLSAGPYDSGAIRFVRLRQFLTAVKPDAVFYEDVKFTPGEKPNRVNVGAIIARAATASELIGSFRATVSTWCEERNIPCTGFPIGTIKRRATGKGVADKGAMIKACNVIFGSNFEWEGYENSGVDNIADSAFVCLLGLEGYGRGVEKINDDSSEEA